MKSVLTINLNKEVLMRQFYWYKKYDRKPAHPPEGVVYGFQAEVPASWREHSGYIGTTLRDHPDTFITVDPRNMKGGD